jgi:hypothetical protein
MTTTRISIAALVAGIAMYFWMSLAHVVLPLGRIGISEINTNEAAVLSTMRTSLGAKPGMYHFPSFGDFSKPDSMKMYDAKLVDSPSGLLIYNPPGAHSLTPRQLICEFLVELLEAALAVYLMTLTRITGIAGRVGFVTLVGLLASLATNVSYWNWYGFPASYTLAYMSTQIVGFLVAGTVASLILRNRT